MKKLLAMFNSLPKEVKMMIAMAGLGTPVGIIFCLQRWVFPGVSTFVIMLGVAAAIGLLALLGFVITKMFGRSSRKRTKKMEAELAGSADAGPVSMDLRASIKSNNEKFFAAIKDMRKLGISVYDLPWYIVIGDSGCGKTKLINEGGLTFSTGKPEGYQLGTLNYNWWFTEDAIFVDMAGRLCNPQEDADRREWEAFLRTVGTGRKGYPINGVLACVSAEHLLQESPEQHEADANTLLERLRDLQSKLGVTFATYLVITKCDKIVGFMQFFDRAERDITIKNQIFGWSRPGDFNELHDPEEFGTHFDHLYGRLNELRLRRLNDDVDEAELGLAYSFPEEFRQVREPLQTYVRTLFPAIKNPRAVKNLIFRGIYFTSATQQGGLILRHLAERLGANVADQFPPLESLYPRPRPHFVKDLFFRKVFPEQGLVFRNEQEVVRNRKLARVLTIGTVALGVILLVLVITSAMKFGQLISEPRTRAQQAREAVDKPLPEAFAMSKDLGRDAVTLRSSVWPSILSLGVGAAAPADNLTTIEMRVFEQGVLRRALGQIDQGLRTARLAPPIGELAGSVPFKAYQGALREYIRWAGCARSQSIPEPINAESFSQLCAVLPASADATPLLQDAAQEETSTYFKTVRARPNWGNPAGLLTQASPDPAATIHAAVVNLHGYLQRFAVVSVENPDPVIHEWMRIRDCCAQIHEAYAAMVAAADRRIDTEEQLESFRQVFDENYAKLTAAMDDCVWRGERTGTYLRIPSLREAILNQRKTWQGYQEEFSQAYAACGGPADAAKDPVPRTIAALTAGNETDMRGLEPVLWESIVSAGLTEKTDRYSPEYFGDAFNKLVREVDEAYGHILVVKRAGENPVDEKLELTGDLSKTIRPVLDKVHERLATLATGSTGAASMQAWIAALNDLYPKAPEPGASATAITALQANWQPEKLAHLSDTYLELIRRGAVTAVLRAMQTRLQSAEPWALAELDPDWRTTQRSAYFIRVPVMAEAPAARTEAAPPPPAAPPRGAPGGPPPPPFGQPKSPAQPAAPSPPPPTAERGADAGLIPKCASPEFFNARAQDCVYLMRILTDFGPAAHFSRAADAVPLNEQCIKLVETAWQRYCASYVGEWDVAYGNAPIAQLERFARWDQGWEAYANQFRTGANTASNDARSAIQSEFQPAVSEILHAIRWPAYTPERGAWLDQPDPDYGAQMGRIKGIYETVVRESWKHGSFASAATAPRTGASTNLRPWDALAGELATRWTEWCVAVGADAQLPRRFDVPQVVKPTPIPWDSLTKLQIETNTQDERFTSQLVEFQKKAQALLSIELTNRFCAIQTEAFADQVPYGGWPYLNETGTQLTALDAVDFTQFTKFLTSVQKAAETLQPLDVGLPDDALRRARQDFVQACDKWRDFLRLSAQGATAPLEVTVSTSDPVGVPDGKERVDDSAQQYYKRTRLSLGLRLQETGGQSAVRPLEFATTADARNRPVQAVWDWTRAPEQTELSFELVDGIQPERQDFRYPDIGPRVLGKPAALAFCAFLHRYGVFVDGNWITTFGVDLAEKFKAANKGELVARLPSSTKTVGEKFIFQLPSGRGLPDPIAKLTPAAGAPTSRP